MKVTYSVMPVLDLTLVAEGHTSVTFLSKDYNLYVYAFCNFLELGQNSFSSQGFIVEEGNRFHQKLHMATLNVPIPSFKITLMYSIQWNPMVLASIVILGFESNGIPDHILLPDDSGSIRTSQQRNHGNPN
jgi:hypothetical protein